MVVDARGAELSAVAGGISTVSGVSPGSAPIRVLHVHGHADAARARDMASDERALGWPVTVRGLVRGLVALRRDEAVVVVLHGRVAGLLGRLRLRGTRTTVLVPSPGTWGRAALLERLTARWANVVLLPGPDEAAAGVRKGLWVPPFVVGESAELRAAVLARAQAFGRPSSATPADPRRGRR
ncbi:hypothetical protein [Nocardioides sp. CER19]|uniref:hypothetical protein n=1 Tax=Nocardioides sp. CER19 TaxID=3038538 RepID=UPI002447C5A3|nr:hypothetical protein [Nocardioides sp. CER19]MDH2414178.1 hypothetical protein [Nocardioides sp. CER19]